MSSSEAEILVQIRRVREELFPALPPELRLEAGEVAAAQIRVEVLRARLEMPPEEEKTPLGLAALLAALVELAGHAEALCPTPKERERLLGALRGAVSRGEVPALRDELARQRQGRG